ncbi:DUF4259 domain-containing protein [Cohnella sp. AR92]|uniref:DUF4259 domain-containing protein n=1 Tax=Cohnella sp. AR92 TaxID=648716 RepID=UPI000F8D95D4|nr:DUF4259 domain-containing protein [Cohnella sp. AR92]RUS49104.1 DUF4259 domain-containing protein [Cohnella sp. AR92]
MGAWGHGNFDNDTVLDWLADLEETEDLSLIEEAIELALDGDSELDADTASIAIGAAEVLAALQNKPGADYEDEELEEWIAKHKGEGRHLLASARKALERIAEESELKELWEESEHFEEWLGAVKELAGRIG